jgi:GSH-dependent disulfide-bond oxidoreductase
MPGDPMERIRALEYTFFQVGGIGPMFGQAGWFARHSEQVPLAIDRYQAEANRLTAVLEARLQSTPWLAGQHYSVADVMNFGWLRAPQYAGVQLEVYPAVQAWVERIAARPEVVRGLQAIA